MRKSIKAALLFTLLPFSTKREVVRYLTRGERTRLRQSAEHITKDDAQRMDSVMDEFLHTMGNTAEKELQNSWNGHTTGSEAYVFLFFLLFGGAFFFLYYVFKDFFQKEVLFDFFFIILAVLIFLHMLGRDNVSVLRKWYTTEHVLNSIFLGFTFSIITSAAMIISNLLFVEEVVVLRGVFSILHLFVAVILGPIVEEIIYRGVVIDQISRKLGTIISVPVSAAIFSLAHIPVIFLDFCFVFFAGVCFGLLYVLEENLISPTIAHSLSNLAVYIFIK
jgi:membrane protease YdiL (CAAX protease family)